MIRIQRSGAPIDAGRPSVGFSGRWEIEALIIYIIPRSKPQGRYAISIFRAAEQHPFFLLPRTLPFAVRKSRDLQSWRTPPISPTMTYHHPITTPPVPPTTMTHHHPITTSSISAAALPTLSNSTMSTQLKTTISLYSPKKNRILHCPNPVCFIPGYSKSATAPILRRSKFPP